mmetsp:Transcript_79319/g.150649  ORF Transcript_79319/g.150649 Transcript_79319/m.150649 type:complete len:290 (-) Transcript_79319:354-1223(-)
MRSCVFVEVLSRPRLRIKENRSRAMTGACRRDCTSHHCHVLAVQSSECASVEMAPCNPPRCDVVDRDLSKKFILSKHCFCLVPDLDVCPAVVAFCPHLRLVVESDIIVAAIVGGECLPPFSHVAHSNLHIGLHALQVRWQTIKITRTGIRHLPLCCLTLARQCLNTSHNRKWHRFVTEFLFCCCLCGEVASHGLRVVFVRCMPPHVHIHVHKSQFSTLRGCEFSFEFEPRIVAVDLIEKVGNFFLPRTHHYVFAIFLSGEHSDENGVTHQKRLTCVHWLEICLPLGILK